MIANTVLVAAFAVGGALLGLGVAFIAHRWPPHPEGQVRSPIDWRSAVVAVIGAVVFGGLAYKWADDPRSLLILGLIAAVLLQLLATDLDQKLLPDLLTLPLIVATAVLLLIGWSPLLAGKDLGIVSGIAAGIGAPVFLFLSDRLLHGDLGDGDLKLSVSIGLLTGVSLLLTGIFVASILFSAVLLVLIALRRLTLKTAVPFGPVLIAAAFVAMLYG